MKIGRPILIFFVVVLTLLADLLINIFASEIKEFNLSLLVLAMIGVGLALIFIEVRNPERNAIVIHFPRMVWLWIVVAVVSLIAIFLSVFFHLRNELSVVNILIFFAQLILLLVSTWQIYVSSRTIREQRGQVAPGKFIDSKKNRASPYASNSSWNKPRDPKRDASNHGEIK